jgi:hypothetical protein
MVIASGGGDERSLAGCPASSRKRSSGPGGQTIHNMRPQPGLMLVNAWTTPRGTWTTDPGPASIVRASQRKV